MVNGYRYRLKYNPTIWNQDLVKPAPPPPSTPKEKKYTHIGGRGTHGENHHISARGEDAANRLAREDRRHVGGREPARHAHDTAL
jgi:hypothetical protein